MLNYSDFKKDHFAKKIKARKKDVGYLTPSKNKTGNKCNDCAYLESFSPYMHRCTLISLDVDNKCVSININGCCNEFVNIDTTGRDSKTMEIYNNIEYDEMNKREAIEAFREANG